MNASTLAAAPAVVPAAAAAPAAAAPAAAAPAAPAAAAAAPAVVSPTPAKRSKRSTAAPAAAAPAAPAAAAPAAPAAAYSGQSNIKPAKRSKPASYSGQSNLAVGLTGLQAIAKKAAKILATGSEATDTAKRIDTLIAKRAYWERVNTFGEAIKLVSTPEQRQALCSLINVSLVADEGKQAFKNQDFRHLACAYDLSTCGVYNDVEWHGYSENKMEATALKWFKGSYSDFIESGLSCFEPKNEEVNLPDGRGKEHTSKLIGNFAASMREYASEKKRERVKLSARERASERGQAIASTLVKEYMKTKECNFIPMLESFVSGILNYVPEKKETKVNTVAILESMLESIRDVMPVA